MAGADNFAELLDILMSASGSTGDEEQDGGIFGSIDPDTLLLIMEIMEKLSESDSNTDFLAALKPLMREENRPKVDRAITVMRLISVIPLLRDSGLAENLFK